MTTIQPGIITTDFNNSNDYGQSVVLQADGKILVAGYSYNSNSAFALARYNSNGSLDTSFDSDGKLTTAIGSYGDYGQSVTLQADGKILVAGYSSGDFALARYNSNGSLDTSFDSDGKVTTAIGSSQDYGYSVTLQADGKILVAGSNYNGSDYDFALVRYNSNGSLDTSFDGDGKLTAAISSYSDAGYSVTLQADGKILVAGYSTSNNYDFALVRYNSNGSLDTSFDGDGKVTTAIGTDDDRGYSVTSQADGKILVAGRSYNSNSAFALVRYNSNGSLDTSFDSDGKVTTAIGSSYDVGYSVTSQADGKILVAGRSYNSGSSDDFALVRYNNNGSLDTSFDSDGKVTTAISSNTDYGNSVTLQADGKILVAGQSDNGSNNDFALVRYNSDGSLDTTFDGNIFPTGSATATFANGTEDTAYKINPSNLLLGFTDDDSLLAIINATATHGKLSTTAGGYLFKPEANYNGIVTLTYQVSDGIATPLNASRSFTLNPVNDVPIYYSSLTLPKGTEDTAYTINPNELLYGFKDVDGDTLAVTNLSATNGTVNNLVFIPNANYNGTVTLNYQVSDGKTSIPASRSFTLTAVNDAPTGALSIDGSLTQGQTLTANVSKIADADGLGTFSYTWKINNITVSTSNTYTTVAADVGKTVALTASYTDATGFAESVSTTSAAINKPPAVSFQLLSATNKTSEGNAIVDATTGDVVKYAVTLDSPLVAGHSVTLNFSSSDTSEATVTSSLIFTASNWNIPQTLIVSGVDDLDNDGNVAYTVSTVIDKTKTDALEYLTINIPTLGLTNVDDTEDTPINDLTSGNIGTTGVDYMVGHNGDDQLYGNYGFDEIKGGYGNDRLYGEQGNDRLFGEIGSDTLYGGDQDDQIYGNEGNDYLWGNGDVDSLEGGVGDDTLDGGTGLDTLVGGAGNDTYYLGYDAQDVINDNGLATDIDTVIMPYLLTTYALPSGIENGAVATGTQVGNLTGNDSNNNLNGNDGDNILSGLKGQDSLIGGSGNDILNGGTEKDVLTGGAGQDSFLFNSALSANIDSINDFNSVDDSIQLENSIFTKLVNTGILNAAFFKIGVAADNNDYLIYNKNTGALYYDDNGNGAGHTVQIALLGKNLALTNADFFVI